MKKKVKGFSLIELMIIIVIIGVLSALWMRVSIGVLSDAKKNIAEASTGSVRLAQTEYLSNNGSYYYTSGGCSSTTTKQIISELFGGSKELAEKDFYYCISKNPNSDTFKITAKRITNNCQVIRDEKNNITESNC